MHDPNDIDPIETKEWIESLEAVFKNDGKERTEYIMSRLNRILYNKQGYFTTTEGILNTPYVNTISKEKEPPYPGIADIEERITNIVRWNAMAMVLKANNKSKGIGGHIATYLSCSYLYEVGYNHFFKGPNDKGDFTGDAIFFQGHSSPGIYARAYLEGILSEKQLDNFRRELSPGGGLPSYPHPRLLPGFWQYPTVSMGLGPLMAIYLARFYKYLTDRRIKDASKNHIFAFIGDGETDEVETLGAIDQAAYHKLDNLIFVINCNLQRLDGPVRGNGKIIQELERIFKGAGWNVIKVIWGSNWDPIFAQDVTSALSRLMERTVDGKFQMISTLEGSERRKIFFDKDPEVKKLFSKYSDEDLEKLKRGGFDINKIYAAYDQAVNHRNGKPTVILAKTVKGYGMGESGEGRNIAHQQKNMSDDSLHDFVKRFNIPIPEKEIDDLPYYRFPEDSEEMAYIRNVRKRMGGFLPQRNTDFPKLKSPPIKEFERILKGTEGREISTTMAFVQILSILLKDKSISKHLVPIIPDESRTFGMEGLFRQYGIYSFLGQLYTPVDQGSLMPYIESKDGQIFQEGINEAGAMCTFIAAGTCYSHQKIAMIPFFIFYSMFGFQRVGDLIWAAADMKTKGFLIGGTAGRTTLNGEGLQHEDGHSLILSSVVPTILSYDPAFAYELSIIIQNGIHRMYQQDEDVFYYITVYNENYAHPPIPKIKNIEEKIIKGMYKFQEGNKKYKHQANILSSGVSVHWALEASEILEKEYDVGTDVWSVTSYKCLRDDCLRNERWNMLHPGENRKSFLEEEIGNEKGVFVGVSDYQRLVPEMIARFIPDGMICLGTDGFGRSSSRKELRAYFEVDAHHIAIAALYRLYIKGEVDKKVVSQAIKDLKIKTEDLPVF